MEGGVCLRRVRHRGSMKEAGREDGKRECIMQGFVWVNMCRGCSVWKESMGGTYCQVSRA